MKLIKLTTIFLLLLTVQFSESNAQSKPYKATKAQTATLKKQALDMASAMQAQNYSKMLYYTYPQIVKAMGGPDKMSTQLQAVTAQMRSKGILLRSVTVGNLGSIIASGGDLYSIVPDVVQLMANGTVMTRGSSFLAISHDQGVHWYFVDTAPLKDKPLKKLFPTYPDGLVLPDVSAGMGM